MEKKSVNWNVLILPQLNANSRAMLGIKTHKKIQPKWLNLPY